MARLPIKEFVVTIECAPWTAEDLAKRAVRHATAPHVGKLATPNRIDAIEAAVRAELEDLVREKS